MPEAEAGRRGQEEREMEREARPEFNRTTSNALLLQQ